MLMTNKLCIQSPSGTQMHTWKPLTFSDSAYRSDGNTRPNHSTLIFFPFPFFWSLAQVSLETACATSKWRQNRGIKCARKTSDKLGKVATKEHWVQDTEQATAKCLYDMNSLKDQTSTDTHPPKPAIYTMQTMHLFPTHCQFMLTVLCHVKRYCDINYSGKILTVVTYWGNNSFLNCCDWCFICWYGLKQIQTL